MRPGIRKTTAGPKELMVDTLDRGQCQKTSLPKISISDNAMLNAIFNSGLLAIAVADDKNRFIEANKKFCSSFNCTKTNILGKPVSFLFPEIALSVEAGGSMQQGVKSSCQKNINISIQQIMHEGRKLSVLMAEDITAGKKINEQLKYSEARLVEAQEVAKVGSWETDLVTYEVKWSLETYRIFGIDPKQFERSHPGFLTFIHPDDRENVDKAFADSLHSRAVNFIDHRICTPSGIKIVEERWRIIRNAEGQPLRAAGTCQEITERRNTEERIIKNEYNYRSLFEQATDSIYVSSHDFRPLDINSSGCRLLGYTKEEFVQLHFSKLFFPEDLIATPFKLEELRLGKPVRTERRYIAKDGTVLLLEANTQLMNDGRYVTFCCDITEKKQLDNALQQAYTEKNTILESIADAFFAVDKNWIVTYWNKEAEKILSTPREKIVGKNIWTVFPNATKTSSYKNYQAAFETNKVVVFEDYYAASNKWFEVAAYPSASGLSVYFKDVTDRKLAAQLIAKSEDKYRTLFEQNVAGVYQTTLNGVILECNDAFAKMLKYNSAGELLCKNAAQFYFSPEQRQEFVSKAITQKRLISYESKLKCKDGSASYFLENISSRKDELTGEILFDGIMIDVSETKRAEILLKESNERFNIISKATNDMVWDWDLLTGQVDRNKDGWRKLFRTPEDVAIDDSVQTWDERVHPDDWENIKQVTDAIKKTEKDFFEVECRVRRDDGTWAYIHDRGHVIRNAQGKAIRLMGATQDITARKEAELKLAKSEYRFRSLVQNGSDLTTILDEKGYYIYCSPAVKRMLGYDPETFAGKNAFAFIHPEDAVVIKAYLSKKRPGGYVELIPFRFKNAKGEWRWMESRISNQCDNPEIKGYVFNSRDITEKVIAEVEIKEAEGILKASEERYRYLFNNNPSSIFIWDLTSFKILEVNDNAVQLYGRERQEFMEATVFNMTLAENHDEIRKFAAAATRQKDFTSEIKCKHINSAGEQMYVHVDSHRIEFKGQPAILALATNITDKVLLEKMLEEEKLARQKEITAAVISAQEKERQLLGSELHDNINQILAGSLLYLGLAKREMGSENAHFRETEILIGTALDEIRKLSHSLISPALSESEFLEAIRNIVQVTEKTSGIKIRLQAFGFDESTLPDKMKLNIYRIIQEQFNNILKHAAAKRILLRLTQECDKTILTIKDDGVGFDTNQKSTGVGLMNMKTRASLFNGELSINSSPGKGSELKVLFTASPQDTGTVQ